MNRRYLFFLFLLLPNYLLANEINHIFTDEVIFVLIIFLLICLCNIPLLINYIIKKKKKTAYWLLFTAIINSILGGILFTETIGTLMLGLGMFSIVYASYHLISKTADKYD